jgi:hypothetical protein
VEFATIYKDAQGLNSTWFYGMSLDCIFLMLFKGKRKEEKRKEKEDFP